MNSIILVYDGTFDGLLTAFYMAEKEPGNNFTICREQHHAPSLFETAEFISTNADKSLTQWKKIKEKLSHLSANSFYCNYLSELPGIESTMLAYLQYIFTASQSVETDFSNQHVLKIAQVAKMVHLEKHRMEAFVRFKLLKDNLFFATIEPDFDVLPLIKNHFTKRYADQFWMIYDIKRKYGLYYDLNETTPVEMDFDDSMREGKNIKTILADNEEAYENLWKVYFKHVNIPERKNRKLHLRHVPKRYWKYLSEKQPELPVGYQKENP